MHTWRFILVHGGSSFIVGSHDHEYVFVCVCVCVCVSQCVGNTVVNMTVSIIIIILQLLHRYCRYIRSSWIWGVCVQIPWTNVNIKIPHETEGSVAGCRRVFNDYRGSTNFVEYQKMNTIVVTLSLFLRQTYIVSLYQFSHSIVYLSEVRMRNNCAITFISCESLWQCVKDI